MSKTSSFLALVLLHRQKFLCRSFRCIKSSWFLHYVILSLHVFGSVCFPFRTSGCLLLKATSCFCESWIVLVITKLPIEGLDLLTFIIWIIKACWSSRPPSTATNGRAENSWGEFYSWYENNFHLHANRFQRVDLRRTQDPPVVLPYSNSNPA